MKFRFDQPSPQGARLETLIELLSSPLNEPRDWKSAWVRRVYLLLWPIAMPIRVCYCAAFVILALSVFAIMSVILMCYETWRGIPNEWSN